MKKYRYNNTNNPIYKAPMALASEALAAGQSWVLIKSLTEKVRLKPRFKYRQYQSDSQYTYNQSALITVSDNLSKYNTTSKVQCTHKLEKQRFPISIIAILSLSLSSSPLVMLLSIIRTPLSCDLV